MNVEADRLKKMLGLSRMSYHDINQPRSRFVQFPDVAGHGRRLSLQHSSRNGRHSHTVRANAESDLAHGVVSSVVVRGRTHPCARPLDPLARANIARRLPTCQEQGRPCLCGCLDPLPPTAGSWKNPQRGRSIVTSGNSVKCRDRRGTERRSEEWVRRSAGRFARGRRLRLGAPRRSLVGRRSTPAHGQPEAEPAVDLPEAAVTAAERRVRRAPAGEAHATG